MTDETIQPHAPYGHPVIATLAGIAVLVIAALIVPMLAAQRPMTMLIGAGAAAGFGLWAVGFVATTRHAATGWKAGSLAILLAAGAGAGLIAHGQYQTRARADASSFAEIELGSDGAPQLPSGITGRGPISKLYAQKVKADARDSLDFNAALAKLGLANLTSPYLLEQDPRAIQNCGAIGEAGRIAEAQHRDRSAREAALATAIERASLPAGAKRGIAMVAIGTGENDARLANRRAMLDAASALCALLAKRSWYNAGGLFGFRSASDAAAFAASKQRRLAIASEGEAIEHAARDRIANGREMVRTALSKSIYAGD